MIIQDIKLLKTPCEDVGSLDEAMAISDKLIVALAQTNGIGLAAPQIGIFKRVFITRLVQEPEEPRSPVIIKRYANVKILKLEEPYIFKNEGCLSFPDKVIESLRYNKITLSSFFDYKPTVLEGLEAVVAQHENDHLNNKLLPELKYKDIGPNDKCRCLSGKKYKACCKPILAGKRLI